MPTEGPAAAYSERFLAHLASPRSQGALPDATHRGEAEDETCGDRMALDLRIAGGIVAEAKFRVTGCPGAIAVGSALACVLPGRKSDPGALRSEDLEAEVGGVPPAKRHALRLALSAWRNALGGEVRGAGGTD